LSQVGGTPQFDYLFYRICGGNKSQNREAVDWASTHHLEKGFMPKKPVMGATSFNRRHSGFPAGIGFSVSEKQE
jgi:hypothetical protein